MVPPAMLAAGLVGQNEELKWADTSQRGYMTLELTPTTATNEWRFVEGIRTRSTRIASTRSASVAAGAKAQEA
jgi:alkaline phosphatase D